MGLRRETRDGASVSGEDLLSAADCFVQPNRVVDLAPVEPISIIVASYNGEKRLPKLLRSICAQDYGRSLIEIIVVDDASTDNTVSVAQSYGARVLTNGHRNIERGKAIGLAGCTNDLVMFLDDDNELTHDSWLRSIVTALLSDSAAVGAQAAWFCYDRADPAINRYCSIFGAGDPVSMFLGRQDHLPIFSRHWSLPGEIVRETDNYWAVRFTSDNFPTLGSQGYLSRKSILTRTSWYPFFFHIDSNLELLTAGNDVWIFLKDNVRHDYCSTVAELLRKKNRDLGLFMNQSTLRRFKWKTSPVRLLLAAIQMLTIIQPLIVAIRAYAKTADVACFLHPYLCIRLPIMYAFQLVRFRVLKLLRPARRERPSLR